MPALIPISKFCFLKFIIVLNVVYIFLYTSRTIILSMRIYEDSTISRPEFILQSTVSLASGYKYRTPFNNAKEHTVSPKPCIISTKIFNCLVLAFTVFTIELL